MAALVVAMVLSRSLMSTARRRVLASTSLPLMMAAMSWSRSTSAGVGVGASANALPATAMPPSHAQHMSQRLSIGGNLQLVGHLHLAIELGRVLLHLRDVPP